MDAIFGPGVVELRGLINYSTVIGELQDLGAALSSETAFIQATARHGGGLFEAAGLAPGEAGEVFAAKDWNATAVLGAIGGTRYGAVRRRVRRNDLAINRLTPSEDRAAFGAFAYWTVPDTPETSLIRPPPETRSMRAVSRRWAVTAPSTRVTSNSKPVSTMR